MKKPAKKKNTMIPVISILSVLIVIIGVIIAFTMGKGNSDEVISKDLKDSIIKDESTIKTNIQDMTTVTIDNTDTNEEHTVQLGNIYSSYIDTTDSFTLESVAPKSKSKITDNSFTLVWAFNKNLEVNEETLMTIKNNMKIMLGENNITSVADIHIHQNVLEVLFSNFHSYGDLSIEINEGIIKSDKGLVYESKITDTFTLEKKKGITYNNYVFSETLDGDKVVELYFDNYIKIKKDGVQFYINDTVVPYKWSLNSNNITIITDKINKDDELIIHIPKESYTFSTEDIKGNNDLNFILTAK